MPQLTRRTNPASFLPVRTKFTDRAYEDDPPEQPIDYSRKYSETKTATTKNIIQKDPKEDKFGSMEYTETDLDQPTDYSLRYAEDDSDSDICDKISKQEYVQDTVKTYCTEGTPYETPFVFSNATSMSDLRNVDEKPEINNDMPTTVSKDNKEVRTSVLFYQSSAKYYFRLKTWRKKTDAPPRTYQSWRIRNGPNRSSVRA